MNASAVQEELAPSGSWEQRFLETYSDGGSGREVDGHLSATGSGWVKSGHK
jgi:hypothetical protein